MGSAKKIALGRCGSCGCCAIVWAGGTIYESGVFRSVAFYFMRFTVPSVRYGLLALSPVIPETLGSRLHLWLAPFYSCRLELLRLGGGAKFEAWSRRLLEEIYLEFTKDDLPRMDLRTCRVVTEVKSLCMGVSSFAVSRSRIDPRIFFSHCMHISTHFRAGFDLPFKHFVPILSFYIFQPTTIL
jgi:hypothetical protein